MLCADKDSGQVAFGAAALTTNVRRLVLYEGWPSRTLLFTPSRPGGYDTNEQTVGRG
jgi:hypothetical protein